MSGALKSKYIYNLTCFLSLFTFSTITLSTNKFTKNGKFSFISNLVVKQFSISFNLVLNLSSYKF